MTFPRPALRRALAAAAAAVVVVSGTAACTPRTSIEEADVPAWQATALPAPDASAGGKFTDVSGRLLDSRPEDYAMDVAPGSYSLTLVCEGGGKAFLAVSSNGGERLDLGAACYGTRETATLEVPGGPLQFSVSSVDAPVLYAYRLVRAG